MPLGHDFHASSEQHSSSSNQCNLHVQRASEKSDQSLLPSVKVARGILRCVINMLIRDGEKFFDKIFFPLENGDLSIQNFAWKHIGFN